MVRTFLFFFLSVLFSRTVIGQVNLSQGLVAHYPFNGNANDASGNGNHGIVNGATLTEDRFGTARGAYLFDGVDDFIQVANSATLNQSQAMTIVVYFNPQKHGVQTIIGKINYNLPQATQFQLAMDYAPYPGILYGVNPDNNGCVGAGNNGAYVNTANPVVLNQWYCAVATFDNSVMRFYVNGILISTTNSSFSTMNACTQATMQIGSWWSGDPQRFKGKIDDVRVYNRALNQQEVDALCPAQPCSDWLSVSNLLSGVKIGDLDIAGNQLTIEATFNRRSPYTGGRLYAGDLVSKHADPNICNYSLRPSSAEITTSAGYFITPVICDIELNKTYHAAMVYDGAALKFYRNGYLMSQVPATGNLSLNDLITTIGDKAGSLGASGPEFLDGFINEVRIWNVARSQTDIRTFMTSSLPNPSTQPGLQAYYVFDNLINKQGNAAWNGTLQTGASIRQTNMDCAPLIDSCSRIVVPVNVVAAFTTPDTVCINNPVTITNQSVGASSYFWNFCVADLDQAPVATNIGNPGSQMNSPVFMDYVQHNGNYYGFVVNYNPSRLTRLDFGNSLLNTPSAVNLGNFGGALPGIGGEGIQIVFNEGAYYAIVVGGTTIIAGNPPRIVKIKLGATPANPAPVATNWGNLGNMDQPIDLHLFQERDTWYGFTVNAENNTITRFNFTNSFENTPTAVNLGNIGNLAYPTGIHVLNDNGNYRVFVTNGGNRDRLTFSQSSLSRLDFGNSLLNTPTGVNLGNPGNVLQHPRDLTIMRSCDQIIGFAVNGSLGAPSLVKFNFNNNLSATPSGISLGNTGGLDFPHSISKLFRVNEDIFGFITNVGNQTISRLRFRGCTNASIPNSLAQAPPAIRYNTPGTYNINLTVDDGLPSQSAYCRQVVVLSAPVAAPTQQLRLCTDTGPGTIRIGTGTKTASYRWNTGAVTDSINVTAAGTYWVEIERFGCKVADTFKITASNCIVQAGFSTPDTVCINDPVTITNQSIGASSYFWNFCVSNLETQPPVGTNLGNIGNVFTSPVYIDYVEENGNFYAFVNDNHTGNLIRLDFGNSLLNIPTPHNLGTLGAISIGSEGIQVVKNEGKWYVLIVGGKQSMVTPYLIKVELGANITNPAPVATNWGNLGAMAYPHDLYVFNDGPHWYGLTVNTDNHTVTRFDFSTSFDNMPVAQNIGNIGNLNGPTGLHAIVDNGNWYAFVTNALDNTITRLDFGNSLLNIPTGQNLGAVGGNAITTAWDISIIKFCGKIMGFVLDAASGTSGLCRLDFGSSILNATPNVERLGNIGSLNFPHSLSKIFRVGADIYSFIPNVNNSSLSRIQFTGCNNASVPNSTAQDPTPIRYNTPGTYNINLTIDDGMATQSTFCRQVVVVPAPVAAPTRQFEKCGNAPIRIGTGTKHVKYLWNTGATTDSITVTAPGTYWVDMDAFGCKATDTFKISIGTVSDFGFKQDVCDPFSLQFFNVAAGTANPWWDLGDGTIRTGVVTVSHRYTAPGDYTVRFSVSDGICADTVDKIIPVRLLKDDVIQTADTVICDGTAAILRGRQGLTYCWSPGTYLDNPSIQNPTARPLQDMTYYLTTESTGANLVVNGDFSAGNTGFTSQYRFTAVNSIDGEYNVGNIVQAWNQGWSACKDHTSGAGNMMLINGSPIADQEVWRQTIAVTPNTNYAFSTWIQSLSPNNPGHLQFSINGNVIGLPIMATFPTCSWVQFFTTWNSGNSSSAVISIVNLNTNRDGNDFALDDISFSPVLVKYDSVMLKVEKPLVRASNDTAVCIAKAASLLATGADKYTWLPATGLSNPAVANPLATPAVSTQYIVTGVTANGCTAKDTVQVQLFPKPVIAKTADTLVCQNTSFPLHISGAYSYLWSADATLINPTSDRPVVTVGHLPVTYHVGIKDVNGCESKDSVKVSIRPYPSFLASKDQAICAGSTQMLMAAGGDRYEWRPAALVDAPNTANTIARPDATTLFSVYVQESTCGFDTTMSVQLTVNPVPVLTVEKENDVNCNTPTAQLRVTGALNYSWSPAQGLDRTSVSNPIAAIDTTTTFVVAGRNRFGCTTIDSIQVLATKDGIPRFVTPNAFTPNGDGNNDCFGIKRWGNAIVEEFAVYNRWGQRVFHANTPGQCWDGRFNGKDQDAGGYVYIIRAKTLCGVVTQKGMVMLMR